VPLPKGLVRLSDKQLQSFGRLQNAEEVALEVEEALGEEVAVVVLGVVMEEAEAWGSKADSVGEVPTAPDDEKTHRSYRRFCHGIRIEVNSLYKGLSKGVHTQHKSVAMPISQLSYHYSQKSLTCSV